MAAGISTLAAHHGRLAASWQRRGRGRQLLAQPLLHLTAGEVRLKGRNQVVNHRRRRWVCIAQG